MRRTRRRCGLAAVTLSVAVAAMLGVGPPAGNPIGGAAPADAASAETAATAAPETARTAAAEAAATAAALPPYSWSIRGIDSALAYRMRYSWRSGCPVPRSDLRYLRMTYVGFDGSAHTGEMVVHRNHATRTVGVFRRLYDSRFPIYRMRLVDDYRGSDSASMDADNTSAFNCRKVTGGTAWSQHSYGRAIDLNPVQNPYVSGQTVEPAAGAAYRTRWPLRKGMVNWTVRDAFADVGWFWGGNWRSPKDYMHFSSNNH